MMRHRLSAAAALTAFATLMGTTPTAAFGDCRGECYDKVRRPEASLAVVHGTR